MENKTLFIINLVESRLKIGSVYMFFKYLGIYFNLFSYLLCFLDVSFKNTYLKFKLFIWKGNIVKI